MHNPWAGYPYHAANWRAFRHRRGGSRLLWFIIGAGTATFWIKSHQAHEWHARNCWRDRIPQDAYPAPSAAAQGQAEEMKREKDCRRWGWWGSRDSWGPWQAPPPQVQQAQAQAQAQAASPGNPAASAQPSPPTSHVLPPPLPTDRWEEERMRVQSLGKQATETVSPPFFALHQDAHPAVQISELSEATLDSVLATVQSLKVVCTDPMCACGMR